MSIYYKYPRLRKSIVAINGIFDDFSNTALAAARWFETWTGSSVAVTYPSAPYGASGNCMKLDGTIQNHVNLDAMGGMSPYPNASHLYAVNHNFPFTWKIKAEFRMAIEDDEPDATHPLACAAGFFLDGNVKWTDDHQLARAGLFFSVANQRAGITRKSGSLISDEVYGVAWAGSLDTWYDIRVEFSYNYFDETTYYLDSNVSSKINITVYVNNVLLFSTTIEPRRNWRDGNATGPQGWWNIGRCGPAICVENDGLAVNGNSVIAYFKDIWITTDVKPFDFNYEDSMIFKDTSRNAKMLVVTEAEGEYLVGKGSDLQIYARNSKTEDWNGVYRGIIRHTERVSKRIISIEAEGYESVMIGEKSDNLSFVAQTAGTIVAAAINNPTKPIFDTSTFFDATSATYTKDYVYNSKMDIIQEYVSLEDYLLFLDIGNCWHFQSYKTNQTAKRLVWGDTQVRSMTPLKVFVREPNKIRVNGTGFTAERELSVSTFADQNTVIRNFNRPDLTTQPTVDDALDYYTSLYREGLDVMEVSLVADYSLSRGDVIRIHNTDMGYEETEFVVFHIKNTQGHEMVLTLTELRPELSLLLSDLTKRTDSTESESVDIEAGFDATKYIEGVGTLLVSAYYSVYNSNTAEEVRSGRATITDKFLDDLVDVLVDGSYTSPLKRVNYLAFGQGTDPANPNDTTLGSEYQRIDLLSWAGANYIQGITKEWEAGISSRDIGLFCGVNGSLGSGTYDLSELGLFDAAAAGNMYVKATFEPLNINRLFIDASLWIKFQIVPSPSFIGSNIIDLLVAHLQNPAVNYIWHSSFGSKPDKSYVAGSPCFFPPNIFVMAPTESNSDDPTIMNQTASGSFSATKIKTRHMIRFEDNYTFDWADIGAGGDPTGDHPIVFFAIGPPTSDVFHSFVIHHRSAETLQDWDTYLFKIVFTLMIKRGDIGWDYPPTLSWV